METNQENIIISEGKRPFWQTCIAALFYTVTIALVLLIIIIPYLKFSEASIKACIDVIPFAVITFGFALRFSLIKNIYFDLDKKKYKKEFAIGLIKIGKWEHLPNIDYICVFRQGWSKDGDGDGRTDASGYRYDVNVWHDRSKHFTIYSNDEINPSYEFAKHLAIKLDVDFLDATIPHEKKWVELH